MMEVLVEASRSGGDVHVGRDVCSSLKQLAHAGNASCRPVTGVMGAMIGDGLLAHLILLRVCRPVGRVMRPVGRVMVPAAASPIIPREHDALHHVA